MHTITGLTIAGYIYTCALIYCVYCIVRPVHYSMVPNGASHMAREVAGGGDMAYMGF